MIDLIQYNKMEANEDPYEEMKYYIFSADFDVSDIVHAHYGIDIPFTTRDFNIFGFIGDLNTHQRYYINQYTLLEDTQALNIITSIQSPSFESGQFNPKLDHSPYIHHIIHRIN